MSNFAKLVFILIVGTYIRLAFTESLFSLAIDPIVFKLSDNQKMHIILDELEVQPV